MNPRAIIYGNRDGVFILNRRVEKEVFEGAIEKTRGEQTVKKTLQGGMSTYANELESFERYLNR